jgi:hypothetical protein
VDVVDQYFDFLEEAAEILGGKVNLMKRSAIRNRYFRARANRTEANYGNTQPPRDAHGGCRSGGTRNYRECAVPA